jgi:hypothetical protein
MASPATLAPARPRGSAAVPRPVLATELGSAPGGLAVSAAVATALGSRSPGQPGSVMAEIGGARSRSPTLLASEAARELEDELRAAGLDRAAARGRLCWLCLEAGEGSTEELERAVATASPRLVLAHVPPALWTPLLDSLRPCAGLLRADTRADRALAALAVGELRERGAAARIATRPLGRVGARRAIAGLDPGGTSVRRIERLARGLRPGNDAGQALPMVLGAALILIVVALALVALAGALTGTARAQRGSDLAALSAARSMRDDLWRLLAPPRLPNGLPNPVHMPKAVYLARASAAAREAASRNGIDAARLRVSFPDRLSPAPLRVRVAVRAEVDLPDGRSGGSFESEAEAHAALSAGFTGAPAIASGGGYAGPLAHRQGKPMRPDVAAAFDRLAAAAAGAGHGLVITSGYRSDAEQARLFAQNPDPRWVAPPGKSLHRCGTELDLGPASAYGWLAANASRFGFLRRYAWEPWHFGYVRGPAPCAADASSVGGLAADGRAASLGLPAFVPGPFRAPIERAAARWSVSAGLLAAQLAAESNFDPDAVSPAGAQGIAQFMPATAAAYGLRDPFDPAAAIHAQAHLMSDLLERFASIPLALAAYNAGAGAVAACTCVPAYPETQVYVARILGLMGAAGELVLPALEVRLVD